MPRKINQKIAKIEKIKLWSWRSCHREIFLPAIETKPKTYLKSKVQLFFVYLLALLFFISLSRLCLVSKAFDWVIDLIINVAIGRTESINGKIAVDFSGCYL